MSPRDIASPWLTVAEAAKYARCSVKTLYSEIAAGRLRAARIGGRRDLRLLAEWIDAWLVATATPVEIQITRRASATRHHTAA